MNIFWKPVEKTQILLKSDKNNITRRPKYIYDHLAEFFLGWEMFHTHKL
jgi:hypothetical protein